MIDSLNRNINYARISVTDRCNLSCVYCMPKGTPIKFLDNNKLLTVSEIKIICAMLSELGIDTIKITGGEPLLRQDIREIIQTINEIKGIKKITLTTNGVLLDRCIDFLHENNVLDINLSLDSLSPQKYNELTNFDLEKILSTIKNIKKYDDIRLKINVVPINIKSEEIYQLLDFSDENNIILRFIEIMPIGYGNEFTYISNDDIINTISKKYGTYKKSGKNHGNGPAKYLAFEKLCNDVGFISAISHNFCSSCNRIRITCDGKIKPCINYEHTIDIKSMIKDGIIYEDMKNSLKNTIYNKPQKHNFDKGVLLSQKDKRNMYQIGG